MPRTVKIILWIIVTIIVIPILLLVIEMFRSARVQYVAVLDVEKAVFITPRMNYPLTAQTPSGTSFRYAALLRLCNQPDDPAQLSMCFSGVGTGGRGYLDIKSPSDAIDLGQINFSDDESYYQFDDGQKTELVITPGKKNSSSRVYADFPYPAPLSHHRKISSSYYRGNLYRKEKDRIDEMADRLHHYQIQFRRGNVPYKLVVDFRLTTRVKGILFYPTSRWISFDIPLSSY